MISRAVRHKRGLYRGTERWQDLDIVSRGERQRHMYFCAEIVPKRSCACMGPMGGILCIFNSIVLSDELAVCIFMKLWTEYLCDFSHTKRT